MIRRVEKKGKTIEEAVQEGLKELDLSAHEVEIEVLEEPSRGILGLVGQKQARVMLTEKVKLEHKILKFFQDLLEYMDLGEDLIESSITQEILELQVLGGDIGTLIGMRGTTLNAVQYIVNLVAGNYWRQLQAEGKSEPRIRVVIDAEGYRSRREASLKRLARSVAEQAKRDGGKIRLEPMTPMERRIVHIAVQECDGVGSFSEGEGRFRHVVVFPKD